MSENPILDDIHRVRAEMLAECGGDIHELVVRLKSDEQRHRDRLVNKETLQQRRETIVATKH